MKTLSERVRLLDKTGDDGWGVYYKALQMQSDGTNVTYLCTGDHDFAPSDAVLDEMDSSARAGNTGYTPVQGSLELRTAIAKQQGVSWQQVAVSSGGQAALFACINAATDPGDRIVCVDPYYATYPSSVRAAGAEFSTVPARAENGFQPALSDLEKACDGARALIINSPNNPTGAVYSKATMDTIRDICIKHDLWLISDEVYETQIHDGVHIRARDVEGLEDRTLTVGSFSKSHVMTGFRIGWVVGPEKAIQSMNSLANATTYGTPGFIQDAALAGLKSGNGENVAKIYKARRDVALSLLVKSNKLTVSPSQGGMYLMLDVRKCDASGKQFAYDLLEAHNIAVMPGESFGDASAGHIRIALTQPEDILTPALKNLIAFAQGRVA